MEETATSSPVELSILKERVRKLALDKSYLQLIINLMNKVSAAQGLDSLVETLLKNILDVIGGTNIILYYRIDDETYYADLLGVQQRLDRIDDELVEKVFDCREALEIEHDFDETRMLTEEFSKAYTWLFPLVAGHEMIGVIKLENLHIAMRDLYAELPVFFNYVAMVLKNEIFGTTRIKQAYDQLSDMNKELELEIGEREQAEEELRQIRDELEQRVELRTAELQRVNEQLQSSRDNQEELIRQRTEELLDRSRELQDNQQALMNIVDDLNQKTEELESANTKLLELDRLKSMFIASMSHELRTPLNSIIGFSSIIRDEWLGPVNQEQKENLETIQRSGKHLLSLINDVIDVSKIEAGRIEARLEEFDLHDLLTEAIQYVEKDLHDKGLELTVRIEHHPLCTDRRRLLQCVINLLSNAVKFTERGGISVDSATVDSGISNGGQRTPEKKPPLIRIAVGDSGIGISRDDIPKLFEPFVRLDSPLKTTAPGTGLGLYLTRKLAVDVLKGKIMCQSDEGVGSVFTLTIPEKIYDAGSGRNST